jgi:NAD+ diphosphatase
MFYTHGTLERADHLRKDNAALLALRRHPATRLVPVWRGTVLVTTDITNSPPEIATLSVDAFVPDNDPIFLGLIDGNGYFAINCTALDDGEQTAVAAQATSLDGSARPAEFSDLRLVGPHVPANDGALLAYARGMVYWQEHSRFCTRCSAALISKQGGHVRHCNNEACGHDEFPRTDPAVIMLVAHMPTDDTPARCLLGRAPAWPEGVYSTLAGFVEPGESLEQAVMREVQEETAVLTTDVSYIASQPWPFPRSIMLGFQALATSIEITCDPRELADARWFTREQLASFGNWGDERYAQQLPRPDSIARYLINRWMEAAQ